MSTVTLQLPARALGRLNNAIADLSREQAKPLRSVNSATVAAAYAVIETYGLLLDLNNPSDPEYVHTYVKKAIEAPVEVGAS